MLTDHSILSEENSLLEHAETVVKLLNSFGKKSKISSHHVLDKLGYLYYRLSDFLAQEQNIETENKLRIKSHKDEISLIKSSIQRCTEESVSSSRECETCNQFLPIINDCELSLAQHIQESGEKHNLMSNKSQLDMPKMHDSWIVEKQESERKNTMPAKVDLTLTNIKCGACKELIPIVDIKYTLAMGLRLKEDTHWKAMASEKNMQEIMNISSCGSEIDGAHFGQYIFYIDSKFYCRLCKSYMNGIDTAKQHIAAGCYANKICNEMKDTDVIVLENGIYFCNLCSTPLSSSVMDHKQGKIHKKNVISKVNFGRDNLGKQLQVSEEKIWLKIPPAAKVHRVYFENVGDNSVFCKLCSITIPKTEVNILSHIHGKQHTCALNKNNHS